MKIKSDVKSKQEIPETTIDTTIKETIRQLGANTAIIDGKCLSVDKNTGNPIQEKNRVNEILEREGFLLIERQLSDTQILTAS